MNGKSAIKREDDELFECDNGNVKQKFDKESKAFDQNDLYGNIEKDNAELNLFVNNNNEYDMEENPLINNKKAYFKEDMFEGNGNVLYSNNNNTHSLSSTDMNTYYSPNSNFNQKTISEPAQISKFNKKTGNLNELINSYSKNNNFLGQKKGKEDTLMKQGGGGGFKDYSSSRPNINVNNNMNLSVLSPEHVNKLKNILPNFNILSQGVINWVIPSDLLNNQNEKKTDKL